MKRTSWLFGGLLALGLMAVLAGSASAGNPGRGGYGGGYNRGYGYGGGYGGYGGYNRGYYPAPVYRPYVSPVFVNPRPVVINPGFGYGYGYPRYGYPSYGYGTGVNFGVYRPGYSFSFGTIFR